MCMQGAGPCMPTSVCVSVAVSNTVEPNFINEHIRTSHFVHYREVVKYLELKNIITVGRTILVPHKASFVGRYFLLCPLFRVFLNVRRLLCIDIRTYLLACD